VGTWNDVDRYQFADSTCGCGPGVGGRLDSADVAAHQHGDVARADVLLGDQRHVRCFNHRVCRFDGADETLCFNQPEGVLCHVSDLARNCNTRFRAIASLGVNPLAFSGSTYKYIVRSIMIRERVRLLFPALVLSVAAAGITACGRGNSDAGPAVATPSVTLSHDRAPAGSPLELTYKFVVAPDAKFDEDFRVFVHVIDTDEEQMWDDDHNPEIPTTQWKPGQTIEYTRTIFVPVFPYVGDATILIGLHSLKDQRRLTLSGEDIGHQSYKVAKLQLLPQTDNVYTVFKDGWHPAETAGQDPSLEWQWTKQQATLVFKNPKKDSVFYFDVDSPGKDLHGPQQVSVTLGGQAVDTFSVQPDQRNLHKIKLPGSLMGDAELTELQIAVDKTFVPLTVTNGASKDPRELGVRVFHAFIDPR
jgi:hypothetical protein